MCILRYLGRKLGYYSSDPYEAYLIDSIVDAALDYWTAFLKISSVPESEKWKEILNFINTTTPYWMNLFEEWLWRINTGYMATNKITIADFAIWDKTCTLFEHQHWKDAFGQPLKQFPLLKKH